MHWYKRLQLSIYHIAHVPPYHYTVICVSIYHSCIYLYSLADFVHRCLNFAASLWSSLTPMVSDSNGPEARRWKYSCPWEGAPQKLGQAVTTAIQQASKGIKEMNIEMTQWFFSKCLISSNYTDHWNLLDTVLSCLFSVLNGAYSRVLVKVLIVSTITTTK